MSDHHGHHHDPSEPVSYVNLFFSIVEGLAGFLIGNSAVVASGAHDFVDGAGLLASHHLNRYWAKSQKHWWSCTMPSVAGMVIAILGPAASMVGLAIEAPIKLDFHDVIIAIAVGIGGLGVNIWSLRKMIRGKKKEAGYKSHFIQDIFGSGIVIVSSLLAYLLHRPNLLIIGTYAIIAVTLTLGIVAAKSDYADTHPKGDHDRLTNLAAS